MATQYTGAELDKMRDAAAEAVRDQFGSPSDPDPWRTAAERGPIAVRLVTDAVEAGVSHREIAMKAGLSGLLVLRNIDDPRLLCEALIAERHHAERYVTQVMDDIRIAALHLMQEGDPTERGKKSRVAEALRITRPTLDDWLRQSAAETLPPGLA